MGRTLERIRRVANALPNYQCAAFAAVVAFAPPDKLVKRGLGIRQKVSLDFLDRSVAAHWKHRQEVAATDMNGGMRRYHLQLDRNQTQVLDRASGSD